MQDGDHFGEIALLQWVPRTATVRTLTNTQCLSLSRERFARLVEAQPELRKVLADTWSAPANSAPAEQAGCDSK
jgi:ATP-binding cassette subfamily B protein